MGQIRGLNAARTKTYQWLLEPEAEQLVRMLEELTQVAHRVNPASWSLSVSLGGSLIVFVRDITVLLVDPVPDQSWLHFDGQPEGLTEAATNMGFSTWNGKKNSTCAAALNSPALFALYDRFNKDALELARRLATMVRTSCARWQEHDRNLVQLLQQRGYDIPSPIWVDTPSMNAENIILPAVPSGFWRAQFRTKVAPEREAFRQLFDNRAIDLSSFSPIETSSSETIGYDDDVWAPIQSEQVDWLTNWMRVGDKIVAHLDTDEFVFGEVIGEAEKSDRGWSRPVDWEEPAKPVSSSKQIQLALASGRMWGISPISKSLFDLMGRQSPWEAGEHVSSEDQHEPSTTVPESPSPVEAGRHLSDHYASHGLTYTPTQIAEFYTALQTKGFVVLSGISGTGKSKIAQHFTEMLPDAIIKEAIGPDPVSTDSGLRFKLSEKETWAAVGADQSHRFPKVPANSNVDVQFVYEQAKYSGSYKTRILAGGRPTLYFILGKALSERLKKASPNGMAYAQFAPKKEGADTPEIRLSVAEPEIPSDQLTEDVTLSNTLFLSVRPDWRDGTSLLGYYNPLTQTYEWTDFLRFILNAIENWKSGERVAWFVILDEMNLAHVEYYFADLLSVLESGRYPMDNLEEREGFTRESIRLTYPDTIVNDAPPTEIHLPPNLYIIGTVNMDETTHAFSPKVLDRAFTMELSQVDFDKYLKPELMQIESEAAGSVDREEMLAAFVANGWPMINKTDVATFANDHPKYRKALHSLNLELAQSRFHFGYRVFDEIMQFLVRAEANGMFASLDDAFDSAVFMKILPKFSGSESRIGGPLQSLLKWTHDPFGDGSAALTRTRDRVAYMDTRLRDDGFVTAF